jgi:hypothetical protein
MSKRLKILEGLFPNLRPSEYAKNSRSDWYNCIAFAVGDTKRRWDGYGADPETFWQGTPGGSLAHLIATLQLDGFELCSDSTIQAGCEIVALYEDNSGGGWTHAARLRDDGWWESKIGGLEDILHKTPQALEGSEYGTVKAFMKRAIADRVRRRLSR